METTADMSNQARSTTPLQDEEMAKPLASLSIDLSIHRSDLVDDSMLEKKGIIIQFHNSNCVGCPQIFGCMRLALEDISKAPAYLSRNRRLVKQAAIRQLTRHMQDMQCANGALESLSLDDYGMTFTVATVTENASKLNPGQRREAPMAFCHYPAMVEPAILTHADWNISSDGEAAHVINCYITLPPPHQRRHLVISKAKQERMENLTTDPALSTSQAGPAKKTRMAPTTSHGSAASRTRYDTVLPSDIQSYTTQQVKARLAQKAQQDLFQELQRLKQEVKELKKYSSSSPPLPTLKPLVWPSKDKGPELPDE